jgi:hypothetical protein
MRRVRQGFGLLVLTAVVVAAGFAFGPRLQAAATITGAQVNVYHDDGANTGACTVVFTIDIGGNVVSVAYNQDDIGLTTTNKTTIDNLITAIKNAATAKLKADMANVTLAAR